MPSRSAIRNDGDFPRDPGNWRQALRLHIRDLRKQLRAYRDRRRGCPHLQQVLAQSAGYAPDFTEPRTLNEKIHWRKLHQRHPVFRRITDKFSVREYVAEQLGEAEAEALFPPLLEVTDTPERLQFGKLPPNLALKCTHASGWNILIREQIPIDHALAVRELRAWLNSSWHPWLQEWSYRDLPRRIVVEELLRHRNGDSAYDLKLHCFHGQCRMIESHTGHFDKRRRHHLGRDFQPLTGLSPGPTPLPRPPDSFGPLREIAETLAQPFDYIRVDFLTTDQGFHLNELTVYPSSGLRAYQPEGADLLLGSFWRLPDQ